VSFFAHFGVARIADYNHSAKFGPGLGQFSGELDRPDGETATESDPDRFPSARDAGTRVTSSKFESEAE
jgi:hypothetical protein